MQPTERSASSAVGELAGAPSVLMSLGARDMLFVLCVFVMLGMSMLAPFNALIAVLEYFRDAYRGTGRGESVIGPLLTTSFNLFAFLAAVYALRAGTGQRRNPAHTLLTMMRWATALVCVFVLLVAVRGTAPTAFPVAFAVFTTLLTVTLAAVVGRVQSSTMVLCTRLSLDGRLAGYVIVGQAIQGVLSSLVNFVSLAAVTKAPGAPTSTTHENKTAALVMFISTALLLLASHVALDRVLRIPALAEWMHEFHDAADSPEKCEEPWLRRVRRVGRDVWAWCLSMALLFTLTLAVYPELTSHVRTVSIPWLQDESLFVALHIVLFNAADFAGRQLPLVSSHLIVRTSWVAMALCVVRFALVPALLWCNLAPPYTPPSHPLPDVVFMLLVWTLGMTTGSLTVSIFVSGPQAVGRTHASPGYPRAPLTDAEGEMLMPRAADAAAHAHAARDDARHDAAFASALLSCSLLGGLVCGGVIGMVFAGMA
ncbi:hypothetical protein MSPP1_000790 [Malassezia sp. CBS 17886]|nr:hypothetical protein MSPP1_000790 [Malassezia sp. CBS 17886]